MPLYDAFQQFFLQYGLIGLGINSFLSSTIFLPALNLLALPVYIALHFNLYHIFLAMLIGSTFGELVNYYLGFFGAKLIKKQKKEILKARLWLNKWGNLSIFIINLIPGLPANIVSIIAGFFKMDIKIFSISMILGKFFQTALWVFGAGVLLKFLPIIGF